MKANLHEQPSEIIVLMYHRIDIKDTDPWGICVSPEHFEEHLKFLKNNFNLLGVADVVKQVRACSIAGTSVCVTFDDGYADNYIHAKPILEKYNCPASFFISTAFINQNKPFWWDELEIILLHSKKLPHQLLLEVNKKTYVYKFNENEFTQEDWLMHKQWKWHETFLTRRCAVFIDIWQKLRPLPWSEIQSCIEYIRNWAGINSNNYTRLPMSDRQLQVLSINKLFTIAMHTHTHPDLKSTGSHLQAEDILTCKKILGNKFGINSNYLAYPYGRYNHHTLETVTTLQIAGCFTTEAKSINVNTNPAMLGRFQVFDWELATFKNHLKGWRNQQL